MAAKRKDQITFHPDNTARFSYVVLKTEIFGQRGLSGSPSSDDQVNILLQRLCIETALVIVELFIFFLKDFEFMFAGFLAKREPEAGLLQV